MDEINTIAIYLKKWEAIFIVLPFFDISYVVCSLAFHRLLFICTLLIINRCLNFLCFFASLQLFNDGESKINHSGRTPSGDDCSITHHILIHIRSAEILIHACKAGVLLVLEIAQIGRAHV